MSLNVINSFTKFAGGDSPFYESDFANNSDGWSTSSATYGGFSTSVPSVWAYNDTGAPSNSALINYDLGAGNVPTEFTLRWRFKLDSGTKPPNYTYFWLAEQDSISPTNATAWMTQAGGGIGNRINIGNQSAEPAVSFTINADTWYYFELVRTTLTTNGIKLYGYSDEDYDDPTLLITGTGGSGSERYLQLKATHNGNSTKQNIDAIKFWQKLL